MSESLDHMHLSYEQASCKFLYSSLSTLHVYHFKHHRIYTTNYQHSKRGPPNMQIRSSYRNTCCCICGFDPLISWTEKRKTSLTHLRMQNLLSKKIAFPSSTALAMPCSQQNPTVTIYLMTYTGHQKKLAIEIIELIKAKYHLKD
jgi:hypothetical protein